MSQTGSAGEPATGLALELPEPLRQGIIEHARRDAPRECCGIISGHGSRGTRLHHLTNLAEGNRLYEIDPAEIYQLEFRELPALGSEIVAIYHSHPETEAYPSSTDLARAFWPGVLYVICSLADPASPVVRAFNLDDATVTEAVISP